MLDLEPEQEYDSEQGFLDGKKKAAIADKFKSQVKKDK